MRPIYFDRSRRNTLRYTVKLQQYETCVACFVSFPIVLCLFFYDRQGTAFHIARFETNFLPPIQPFTDLGFDMLANNVSLDGSWDLARVADDSHIVYLGRPL